MIRIGKTRLKILGMLLSSRYPLTVRDLCRPLGFQINGVREHLRALKRAGLVTWEPYEARTIRPTCRFIPEANHAS